MELLLILLAIVVAGVAVSKVLKAKELVDALKDPEAEPISPTEIRTNALGWLVFGIVLPFRSLRSHAPTKEQKEEKEGEEGEKENQ